MSFDVVIPTLGRSCYLESLIEWLHKQGSRNIFLSGSNCANFKHTTFIQSEPSYSKSVNNAVKHCQSEFILIMNDDIKPKEGCVESMLEIIKSNPDIFAVVPMINTQKNNKTINESLIGLDIRNARPWPAYNQKHPGYANGACFLTRKEHWCKLNGFSEAFHPAYWEDVDISFRAKEQGLSIVYTDSVKVDHIRGVTTGDFSPDRLNGIFLRGQRIFTARHYKALKLNVFWWFFEILSQGKDLIMLKWRKLLFRWGVL